MTGLTTRAIGRIAVRDELARIALARFFDDGFDNVRFEDLAAAAEVSRSTFHRYFSSKEDVVLFVFDPLGSAMASALSTRPESEDEWAALRGAVNPAVELLSQNPDESRALLRLIWDTPALWARLHEKQSLWRPELQAVLSERAPTAAVSPLAQETRAMAALGCLMVALDSWLKRDQDDDLSELVDLAFDALALPEQG